MTFETFLLLVGLACVTALAVLVVAKLEGPRK